MFPNKEGTIRRYSRQQGDSRTSVTKLTYARDIFKGTGSKSERCD
jgi:hypothetical protein